MSVEVAIARINEINTMLAPRPQVSSATTGGAQFDAALASATSGGPMATAAVAAPPGALGAGGGSAGARALAAAQAEVGQAEQPPGSNDSPRIAQYRQATAGSGVGPWCAYFVSWAAQ